MATTQQEIPIGDDELDALMAELETETQGMVAAPAPVAKPEPVAEVDEMAALEAELALAEPEPAPAPKPAPVVAAAPEAKPEPEPMNTVDDEMAALEAELNGTPAPAVAAKLDDAVAAAKDLSAAVSKAFPEAAAEVDAKLTPEVVAAAKEKVLAKPEPVLKAVPTPEPEEVPVAPANPLPKPAPAALSFFIDVAQFRDETRVAEHNLDDCMMQQAGLRAYYAEQAARAEAQHDRIKARFKVLEAQLYDQHRKALIVAGEKVTEKAVENAVLMDPKWIKNQNVVIEAQTIANINRGLVDSLKDRKDMLVQLGADRREEGKGQLRVMAGNAAHDDMKARAVAAATRSA